MMTPDFPAALKEALEQALGFRLKPLERLDGNETLNFRATRLADGLSFAVKCSPPSKREGFEALRRTFAALEGAKTAHLVFPEAPVRFRGYDLMCQSWCEGVRLFPDRLTDEQARLLVSDYETLSAALQRVRPPSPPTHYPAMRRLALERCRGFRSAWVRRLLETELTDDRLALRPELTKVIHGDMHHGNFLFRDGLVSGFFDFENVTAGYPAEDFVRYFVCAAEHLRWYNQHRKWRILHLFKTVVAAAPYSGEEWDTALRRLLFYKVCRKVLLQGCGLWMSLNLLFRARYYRTLRRAAVAVCEARTT